MTASQYGVLTRLTVHNGAREEVPWTSRQYGGSLSVPPTSTLAKATAPGHNLLRSSVVCLRLSPRVPSRYCLALDCGIVLVLTDGHVTMDVPHKGEVCADCQWDPLSDNYLLVGCVSGTRFQPPACSLACAYCLAAYTLLCCCCCSLYAGTLHMYDVESKQPLQTFDKTQASSGLTMLAWIPGVPGDFLTVSSKTGVLRIWNVSNRSPKDVIKAEAGPFHGISFSDSQRALCRFKSGAVGLLDLKRKSWAMFGRAAHTDTVFAAAYKPADPNMLATCSFDGSVRIWDTRLNRLYRDLVAEDVHVLYALSWSPHDETRLVTTSSHGMVLIWDVENSVLHTRVQLFGDGTRVNPIHAVDWG